MRISKHQFQNQRKIRSQINSSQIIGPEFREMDPGYFVMERSQRKLQGTLAERKASISDRGGTVFQMAHLCNKD